MNPLDKIGDLMQLKPFVKIISIFSIGFLNANANELPESHEKHLPDLLSLADELQGNWEEIQYSQNDPSTWVQMSWITKHRARIIGTILLPGIGTAIGHAVDRHDDRVQTAKNEAKQKDEAKSRQQEAERREGEARAEIARLQQERAEAEARYQAELNAAAENARDLQRQINDYKIRIKELATQVPEHIKNHIISLARAYEIKIENATTLESAHQAYVNFYEDLEYTLKRLGS